MPLCIRQLVTTNASFGSFMLNYCNFFAIHKSVWDKMRRHTKRHWFACNRIDWQERRIGGCRRHRFIRDVLLVKCHFRCSNLIKRFMLWRKANPMEPKWLREKWASRPLPLLSFRKFAEFCYEFERISNASLAEITFHCRQLMGAQQFFPRFFFLLHEMAQAIEMRRPSIIFSFSIPNEISWLLAPLRQWDFGSASNDNQDNYASKQTIFCRSIKTNSAINLWSPESNPFHQLLLSSVLLVVIGVVVFCASILMTLPD